MEWSGRSCTIEQSQAGLSQWLEAGDRLTFPAVGEPIDVSTKETWGTVSHYEGLTAYVVFQGVSYRIEYDKGTYRCDPALALTEKPSGGGRLASLAGALAGVIAGTAIGALLGLPLATTVAVAAGAALVQLAISAGLRPPRGGQTGTTWTARDTPS